MSGVASTNSAERTAEPPSLDEMHCGNSFRNLGDFSTGEPTNNKQK